MSGKELPHSKDRPEYVGFAASDWQGGCATLPPMVEWVYLQISLYCMDKGEAVPKARLPMILVRHGGDWQADIDLLIELGKVIPTQGGALFVKRALTEYTRAEMALSKRRKAGKKGAEKRWNSNASDSNAKNSDGNANGDAIENGCDANGRREEKRREETINPNGLNPPKPPADLFDMVDPEIWKAFVEHRIKLKAPMTDRAAQMIRTALIKIHEDEGHPPNAVLEQSIMRGWKGVFPLKDDGKGSGWSWANGQ